ncbi:hypothetical protein IJ750_05430 [bacterium]|nr:hypothetical protein [bacterium]
MSENLDINTKLYSYDGILGRRDYCINLICISAISFLANIPFIMYWLIKCSSLENIFQFNTIFYNAPIILKVVTLIGAIAVLALWVPTIHRRIRDLCAKTNNFLTAVCVIFMGLTNFWFIFQFSVYIAISFVTSIVGLCLLFIPGKVTSKLPYDYTKDFNWGAYFGTWIWGLYNRSYTTLFIWALYTTPFSELFKLYCGLKGNEWAYKGKKWNDVKAFNKSQKKQTIFFICLKFLIIPALFILPIVLIIALLIALSPANCNDNTAAEQLASPPAVEQKIDNKKSDEKIELDGVHKSMAFIYFDSYEFSENEYKFYVSENDWKTYTIFDKLDLMNKAQKISKGYCYKLNKIKYPNGCPYSSDSDNLRKVKLYSTEKHQLLGEFNSDVDWDNISAKQMLKSIFKMWKFYDIQK